MEHRARAWALLQASHTVQGTPSSCCLLRSVNCRAAGERAGGKAPHPRCVLPITSPRSSNSPQLLLKHGLRVEPGSSIPGFGGAGPLRAKETYGLITIAQLYLARLRSSFISYKTRSLYASFLGTGVPTKSPLGRGGSGKEGTQMSKVMKVCLFALPSSQKVVVLVFHI